MARIGIMGGTFDPIHNVHLMLGIQAYREYHLDSVWYMPSKCPPHKSDHVVTSTKDRCEMVRLAVHPYPFMVFSDFELLREGNTYTADTLRLLHESYPEHEFFFIIGADSLFNIERWYHPEQVLTQAVFLVAGRLNSRLLTHIDNTEHSTENYPNHCCFGCHVFSDSDRRKEAEEEKREQNMEHSIEHNMCAVQKTIYQGESKLFEASEPELSERKELSEVSEMEEKLDKQIAYLSEKYHTNIFRLHTEDTDVSSTRIRDMVFYGESIRHMVPAEVAAYIERFCLYQRVSE